MKRTKQIALSLLAVAMLFVMIMPAAAAPPADLTVSQTDSETAVSFFLTPDADDYAVIHYHRPAGDYGTPSADFNTYWGLHLWGDGLAEGEGTAWTEPRAFAGVDEYGTAYVAVKLADPTQPVNYIIHKGDEKDTSNDRNFTPGDIPELWIKQGDDANYASRAEMTNMAMVYYQRADGDYDGWGLHLWGDGLGDGVPTDWADPRLPDRFDDYGAVFDLPLSDATQPVNFIVHKGDDKDTDADRAFTPSQNAGIYLMSGQADVYTQRGAAENYATIHYRRSQGDYEDWGLHLWGDSAAEGVTWTEPFPPTGQDDFGLFWNVPLTPDPTALNYIIHKGDEKDPGPDQALVLADSGYEIWQIQGDATQYTAGPAIPTHMLDSAAVGDLGKQQAFWVNVDTIAWPAALNADHTYELHFDPDAGLTLDGLKAAADAWPLTLDPAGLPDSVTAKFPHLAGMPALKIPADKLADVPDVLKSQFAVSAKNADGDLLDATGLQIPGVLDDLFAHDGDLGVTWDAGVPTLRLWAPTAQNVRLLLFDGTDPASAGVPQTMDYDPASGVWSVTGAADWTDKYYLYEVMVFAPSTGNIETNLVTDPYSLSLSMNSARTQIVDLSDAALAPDGWEALAKPPLAAPEDISVYEIHMRDFSANDATVPDELKGTYKAFTLDDSDGVKHLQALQAAGLTHLHLLPVFDIATIDEDKANWQEPDPAVLAAAAPDSEEQQAAVVAVENLDAFNWGYDPYHYTVPEGSYSTNPDDATRVLEFREMVQALNEMGLRVVMDVVYNHTNAAGQAPKSVLDRIVPGYYHRLNADGQVETSTCCANTASEHAMMEKLMVDSLVTWARDYKIDAFRFDLMGHHMVTNMAAVRAALDALTLEKDGVDGKSIYLYGEGWNFGEVADDARGENATQLNLAGTGIGTFSDRLRDAVRGASPFASGEDLKNQGFADGLFYDPNDSDQGTADEQKERLLLLSDQTRVGMAGNLADYVFEDRTGNLATGKDVDYNGQPTGYALDPQEVINYVSKHDNQTLYDIYAYGLPAGTGMADRVRVQAVGLSTVLLGQGVPFLHAGSDLLRSKSLDRDSYNSGDWFNKLDFSYQDNNFGVGLPVASKNEENWPIMGPLLADPALQPAPADIAFSADLFQELLQIRYSSPLFRLQTAGEVQRRVGFHNTGPDQIPGLIVMSISDIGVPDLDPNYEQIVVLINANDEAQTFALPGLAAQSPSGNQLALHPVQQNSVDDIVKTSTYDAGSGQFAVPARTTAVFVENQLGGDDIVSFPGDYPEAAGLGPNWTPDNPNIQASDDNGDGVWKFVTDAIPAGSYNFKAAVGGTWDENYPADNVPFTVAADGDFTHFYYDRSDNTVASRPDSIIPVVAGSFGGAIGGADWSSDNLTTWMKDPDGDGVYVYETATIPPGSYEFKVALNEGWDQAYPADNVGFTVDPPGAIVIFSYDSADNAVMHEVRPFEIVPPPDLLVTFPGDYPEAAGLGPNWSASNTQTQANDDNMDGVWKFVTDAIPAGDYQFKAAVGGTWDEAYPADNVPFTVAADGDFTHFYYDRDDNTVASRPNARIPVLVGDMMELVGGANWSPDNLTGWMKDPDGDGMYEITLDLPEGDYQYKVALNEGWDEAYPADNAMLSVPAGGETVTFWFDSATNEVTDSLIPPPPPEPVTIELPLVSDTWIANGAPAANFDGYEVIVVRSGGVDLGLFEFNRAALPPNSEIVSATFVATGTFQSGAYGKEMAVLNVDAYDSATVTWADGLSAYNPGPALAVPDALGRMEFDVVEQIKGWDALGAPATDKGYLALSMAGPWGRVAMSSMEAWPYNQHARLNVSYIPDPTLPTLDQIALAQPPAQAGIQDEVFYFVLPDRFYDLNPANNYGDDPGGDTDDDVRRHGYRPRDKAYFHGGDIAGLTIKLDYLDSLGVTALWITPPFANKPTQPDSSTDLGVGAGYHGYWILDYEKADPHLGSNADLQNLINAAHARGMKVYFDMVVNHTADVISYAEGEYSYRNKADFPYKDADGNAFDDADFAGKANFPALDPTTSFPYSPIFADPADATAKNPAWLNNPVYYHNRGNSSFAGEDALYGDFYGLDDLFTEHPDVVDGYVNIFKSWIDVGVDGFRLDTAKHVNMEFWSALAPEVIAYAQGKGKPDFSMFGEVLGGDAAFRSDFTDAGQLPSLLDFGLHGAAIGFAANGDATDGLRDHFASDDHFTDVNSNAYQLGNFVSNHDAGRLGREIVNANAGADDAEMTARAALGQALTFFARGFPIVYYGDEQGFTGDGGDKDAREDMLPSQTASYNDNDLIGTDATTAAANFDADHPLYKTIADFAALRGEHVALRRGAQIHRYSEAGAGIYAFSRIDRGEKVEYVVALNNAEAEKSATFATYSPDTMFEAIYPPADVAAAAAMTTDGDGNLAVTVPPLSVAVYKAASAIPASPAAPDLSFSSPEAGAAVNGQVELAVTVGGNTLVEVSFLAKVGDGDYTYLGTDADPPYRLFYDTDALPNKTLLHFLALATDVNGHYRLAMTDATVTLPATDVIVHYQRPDGAYDDWGLHLWGDGLAEGVGTDWNAPMAWNGEDEFGRFAWFKADDPTLPVGVIVHMGDAKDPDADLAFTPADTPEIWIMAGDPTVHNSAVAAQGYARIHYNRPGDDYDGWGLHLWGDAIAPGEGTDWNAPKLPDGFDDFGAFFDVALQDAAQPVNFIVHMGDEKDTDADRSFTPAETGNVWLKQGDAAIYEQRGAAENYAILHYHRPGGDYDGWGLHLWGDTTESVSWTSPLMPIGFDAFGAVFEIGLTDGAGSVGYIMHKGDEKDPGPDQFLTPPTHGYEVWQLQGADPDDPFLIP